MASITLPSQSYVCHAAHNVRNGSCLACFDQVFGDMFVCRKGTFCIDCAVAAGYLCGNCMHDTDDCICVVEKPIYKPSRRAA